MTAGIVLLLLTAGPAAASISPPNWTGPYAPCTRHSDLLGSAHLDLGVRISTSNASLAREFARAMDFWAGVLDLDWHQVDSTACALQLVDGTPWTFASASLCGCLSARSQFPDRPGFEGWIAFNPALKFSREEMFLDSVHEIGHLLGLPHNPSNLSVMFYAEFDKTVSLDAADLESLASRHKLRASVFAHSGLANARVPVPLNRIPGRDWRSFLR